MAKINGIEMKSIKSFVGHEGMIAQANVYCNGKKIGFWSQDSWGGPDEYSGCENTIAEKAKLFKEGCPSDVRFYEFLDKPDIFMCYLLELSEDEKHYKKCLRRGYSTLFMVTDGYHVTMAMFRDKVTESEIESKHPDTIGSMKSKMFKNSDIYMKTYTSLDDFSVVVDKNHPVPSYIHI